MRVHFREKPWDLYWLVGYTIIVAGFLLVLGVGSLPAILFVLFAPGYVVVAALFPGSKEINWVERLALSFGMSIAIVPLLGLALNFTPFGIRFAPIVVTIALFTVLCGGAAWFRRMRMPSPDRLSATFDVSVPAWRDYSLSDRILTAALVASIVMAASALAYIVASPSSQHRFTEFYILGPSGNASGYPTTLKVSQPGSLILGLANHESATVRYAVRIDLVGVRIVYNATSGFNETVDANRTTLSLVNTTLADGRNWTQLYTFSISSIGLWKLQFLLFKDDILASQAFPQIFIRVS